VTFALYLFIYCIIIVYLLATSYGEIKSAQFDHALITPKLTILHRLPV